MAKTSETSASTSSAYLKYALHFGHNVSPIFALDDEIDERLNLLILIGGADVSPLRYGHRPQFETQNPNIELEYFDEYVLP